MRKKTFHIPLTGPLNTRIDPRLASLPLIQRADNLYRARTGEWTKRHGFTVLPTTYSSPFGNVIDRVRKLAAREDELMVVDTKRFWSWSNDKQTFFDLSRGAGAPDQTVVTHEIQRFDDNPPAFTSLPVQPAATESDMASGANCLLTAWAQIVSTVPPTTHEVYLSVLESDTGQFRLSPTAADQFAGVGAQRDPRCVFAAGYFLVFLVIEGAATSTLRVFGFRPSDGNIRPAVDVATDVIGTGTGTVIYDVYVRPDNGRVLVAYRSSASTLKALEWSGTTNSPSIAAVTVVASDVAGGALGWIDSEVASVTSPRLATAVNSAVGVVRRILNGTTLAETSSTTIEASPGDVSAITGIFNSADVDDTIFWQVEHATDVERTAVKYGRSSTPTVVDFARVGALASKAFRITPTGATVPATYVLIRQPWKNQGMYLLASGTQFVGGFEATDRASTIARILRGRTPHTPARRGALTSVSRLSTTRIGMAGLATFDAAFAAAGDTLFSRPIGILVEFSGGIPEPVALGGQTFFPGSLPRFYGGRVVAEMGFQVDPTSFVSITVGAGGSLSAGVYQYTQVFCHQDNEGRVWRSGPGPVFSVTAALNDAALATFKRPMVFGVGRFSWVEIYRTRVNGTQFFRVPLNSAANVGLNLVVTQAVVDNFADTDLERNFPLYVDGGELFNSPPPPCLGAVAQGSRIVVIDAENPTRIAASKEMQPGQGTGWHADLQVDIQSDGPNTALALVEGRVVVFKRQAVYLITGDWPDANGQGPLPTIQKIATGFGTAEPESVCQSTDGVWFKDPKKGICFLDRGLQITQLGKPVQSDDANDIVAATIAEEFEQIRFLTANGRSPVYDYLEKQWSTFFGTGALIDRTAAAVVDGLYYIARANRVYFYDTAQFGDDGAAVTADLVMRLTFDGLEGIQRIYRITLFGQVTALTSFTARLTDDHGDTTIQEVKNVSEGVQLSNQNDPLTVLPGSFSLTLRPRNQRTTSVQLQLSWPQDGTTINAGVRLSAVAVEVGFRDIPNLRRLPARSQR